MADSLLDFAGLDAAASAVEASATATDDVATTEVDETPAAGADDAAAAGDAEKNADGSAKEEVKAAEGTDKDKAAEVKALENTPQNVRQTLKALKDANPANAKIVNELHGAYERWAAAKGIFPKGVQEMKAAKEFIDLVGGAEGYEAQQAIVESIKASDAKIYSGDPSIHDDIIEDLKSEGKIDAYGKIITSGVEKLKSVDADSYKALTKPILHSELSSAGFPGAAAAALKQLTLPADAKPEDVLKAVAAAKEIVSSMDAWWKGLDQENKNAVATKVDPAAQKLAEERQKFQNEQKEFATKQTKEFQDAVVKESGVVDRNLLGKALTPFTKTAYFSKFTRTNWQPLATAIQSDLYETLKADKTYQAQMKAMWSAPKPDKAKILEYRRAKVEGLASTIVNRQVQTMYPDHAKGGAAAGRVAAAKVKSDATAKSDAAAASSGKPVYVAVKPAWDSIDWDKDPKKHLYIAGKAYLRGGKLVTWRK